MRTRLLRVWTSLFSFGLFIPVAQAVIIGGDVTGGTADAAGGIFVKLTPPLANPFGPPNSVGDDTFQTPNLYGFDENQNFVLGASLNVNFLAATGLPGALSAGTAVASHYVFFDPGPAQSQIGHVDFNAPIVAIITSTNLLFASDFLASTGVNYLNPAARGLEAADSATLHSTLNNRLVVNWNASNPGDYVRVLTARPVPETGATLGLLSLSLLLLAAARRWSIRPRVD